MILFSWVCSVLLGLFCSLGFARFCPVCPVGLGSVLLGFCWVLSCWGLVWFGLVCSGEKNNITGRQTKWLNTICLS